MLGFPGELWDPLVGVLGASACAVCPKERPAFCDEDEQLWGNQSRGCWHCALVRILSLDIYYSSFSLQ